MHNGVTSWYNYIYSSSAAYDLFDSGKYTYQQISEMKWQNIRESIISNNASLAELYLALGARCGHCFMYRSVIADCNRCPILRKLHTKCICIKEWDEFKNVPTLENCDKLTLKLFGKVIK